MKHLCSLLYLLVFVSLALAAETDNSLVKPLGITKDTTASVPKLNLHPPYLTNYKIESVEAKSSFVQIREPKIIVFATNDRRYISGWDPDNHSFALAEDLVVGSMRHVDIAHGVGLGYDFTIFNKKMRGWASYANNRVDGEGKKIILVAVEFPF